MGKRTAVIIPVLHGLSGKSRVCGSRVLMSSRQVNVSCRKRSASSLVRAFTSPMNMRKPCSSTVSRQHSTQHQSTCQIKAKRTCRLESLHFGCLLEVVEAILHVIHRHSPVDPVETRVGDLRYALVCAVSGFEVAGGASVVFLFLSPRHINCRTERRSSSSGI